MADDFLNELNSVQREAVEQLEGPVMIIAGAGSGKTRVLTYRIALLINSGVDSFNILALTFTNKAAREMKDRIAKIAGDDARNLWMGTYHSVFARVLRIEAEKIGFPSNFTIYDTDDSKSLVRSLLKEQGLDDKTYPVNTVLNRISGFKNNLKSWQHYQQDVDQVNHDTTTGKPMMGLLFELYSKRCMKSGAMDFDDILYFTYALLAKYPDVLLKYQNKFKFVLVDEFQDTNFAQYQIVKKLAAQHENICVVGDDAQSIYAFRGANIQNILNFEKDYPDLKTYKLEQNYRSTKIIVDAANGVIAKNKRQLKKNVWTDNKEGDKIKLIRAISDNEEGNAIANEIFQTRMNDQLLHKDFAILYRTNAQSRALEEALRRMNLPYRIYGGLSFYARKEVKDLLAYFRLALNHNDEEALKRVINLPKRGVGDTSIDKMIVATDRHQCSLWDVVLNVHDYCQDISASTRAQIQDFGAMIKSFAVLARQNNAYEAAAYIAEHSGLLKMYFSDKTPEGVSHYENMQELMNGVKEFTDNGRNAVPAPEIAEDVVVEVRKLDLYMQDIALLTDADNDKKDGSDDKISLMTVHAAKGLEFKHVFIAGLEENLFPSMLSLNNREDLEEERRLFYVAITRAEHKLCLSYAMSRYRWGNLQNSDPSRFLNEIDPAHLEVTNSKSSIHDFAPPADDWSQPGKSAFRLRPTPKQAAQVLPSRFKKVNAAAPAGNVTPATIEVGNTVMHDSFGTGTVIAIEGTPPNNKCTIQFKEAGSKTLLMKYARLRIVE